MKCGAIFSGVDVRDYKMVCAAQNYDFPDEFELKTVRIKNQDATNSCVAHSLSSIIEYYNNKQNNDPTEMSIGYIYGNRNTSEYKGEGMIMRDALEAVRKYGDVYKSDFINGISIFDIDNMEVPYSIILYEDKKDELYDKGYPHRISQYCRVESVNAIKASLYAGNPVLMAMMWYDDMEVIDGVLTTSYVGYAGGHCMFIYGWNEIGWKVQNSWGEDWGVNGCMIIPYEMPIEEFWTLTDEIIEGTYVKKPFSSNAGKFFAKFINKVKICTNNIY